MLRGDLSAQQVLTVALDAARIAGSHMQTHLGTQIEKTKSSKDDLVTKVDKECQELIENRIKSSFPTHGFLGEEDVMPGSTASSQALHTALTGTKEWLWIVCQNKLFYILLFPLYLSLFLVLHNC